MEIKDEKIEEVEVKTKETKSKVKKPKAKKVIEKVDAIIEDEVVMEENVEEEVVVKKSYSQLKKELKSKKNDIEVEILSLNTGRTVCRDRNGRILFELDNYGDREFISLEDMYEIASRDKAFFEKHLITIIDIDTDDYSLEEIIEFLNLNEIYNGIENYDTDYIIQILKLDNAKFKSIIETCNEDLVRVISSKAISMFKEGKFDSRIKENVLSERLGKDYLFEI